MFSVFGLAAADDSLSVAKLGLELMQRVIREHASLIVEHHSECGQSLAAYLVSSHDELALLASTMLVDYSKLLHPIAYQPDAAGPSTPMATEMLSETPAAPPEAESVTPTTGALSQSGCACAVASTSDRAWWTVLGAVLLLSRTRPCRSLWLKDPNAPIGSHCVSVGRWRR